MTPAPAPSATRTESKPRFDAHLHLSRYWPDPERNRYDPSIDFSLAGLLREMDTAGIGHGILLQVHESPSLAANLREGASLLEASAGRLLRTSTVDPTKGRAAVAEAVAAWEPLPDLKAIKLYPGYQAFYPHDPVLDPIYELAARRGLVVIIHQGDTLDPNGRIRFARPIEADEVAVRFREVRFVLCHLGNPWIEEAAELVYKNPNVYTDTSGLLGPEHLPHFPAMFEQARLRLADVVATLGDTSRVLYGSDWPLESLRSATALVDTLDIPLDDRRAILGENARRLFGVPVR